MSDIPAPEKPKKPEELGMPLEGVKTEGFDDDLQGGMVEPLRVLTEGPVDKDQIKPAFAQEALGHPSQLELQAINGQESGDKKEAEGGESTGVVETLGYLARRSTGELNENSRSTEAREPLSILERRSKALYGRRGFSVITPSERKAPKIEEEKVVVFPGQKKRKLPYAA